MQKRLEILKVVLTLVDPIDWAEEKDMERFVTDVNKLTTLILTKCLSA